ncbi:MAG: ABC transporter permease [Chloroflexi bacterium]|nr:MAG: ABC transporter permease [Chloroflexota bacterium]
MGQFILRRTLLAIPTLLIISLVIFVVLALAPGDPLAQFALNPAIPESTRELIRHQLGIDQPWYVQYYKWLTGMFQGNFSFSFATKAPVIDLLRQRLPQTLQVVGSAYLIAIFLAIPIGILSAVKQYSVFDQIATIFSFIGSSIPSFFTGIILILVFAVSLRWFPIVYSSTLQVVDWGSFMQYLQQMILPITVLVVQQTAAFTRFMRSTMLDNLPLEYVRTARAKGLGEQIVVWRHVVRNSLIPVVTLIALGVPTVFGGAIITENLFRVNGIGQLLITSIQNSDTPVVMAITFIFAVLTVTFNLVADILYGVLDPRVRYS